MTQSEIVKRVDEVCHEFDSRLASGVTVPIARLELSKALAETESALGDVLTKYNASLDAMEQLRAENAAMKAERQWIPVSERLPENHDDVLLWDYGEISCGWYSRKHGCFISYKEAGKMKGVTHWMNTLPAPDNQ